MKWVEITLRLRCRDDVPVRAMQWMAENLEEHALHEFGADYDPAFGDGYEGPPLAGDVEIVRLVPDARYPNDAG